MDSPLALPRFRFLALNYSLKRNVAVMNAGFTSSIICVNINLYSHRDLVRMVSIECERLLRPLPKFEGWSLVDLTEARLELFAIECH
mmetsp:Transcript_115532/g.224809  ORF Transcript_115532/g.224809 Transcript_115532/m.224809 type:complete len:87 (+) Transcript_115532:433-693(+)